MYLINKFYGDHHRDFSVESVGERSFTLVYKSFTCHLYLYLSVACRLNGPLSEEYENQSIPVEWVKQGHKGLVWVQRNIAHMTKTALLALASVLLVLVVFEEVQSSEIITKTSGMITPAGHLVREGLSVCLSVCLVAAEAKLAAVIALLSYFCFSSFYSYSLPRCFIPLS